MSASCVPSCVLAIVQVILMGLSLDGNIWKAIWVFIQHFPISGNQFSISGNDQFPDIGKWFSDIGNWFADIRKCARFPDIGKSIPDIRKSPPDRSRSLRHPATPPYHTAPINNGPQPYRTHLLVETVKYYDLRKSISATNNNHTTDDFAQKYRNLWCWINVLNDFNKNWTLR